MWIPPLICSYVKPFQVRSTEYQKRNFYVLYVFFHQFFTNTCIYCQFFLGMHCTCLQHWFPPPPPSPHSSPLHSNSVCVCDVRVGVCILFSFCPSIHFILVSEQGYLISTAYWHFLFFLENRLWYFMQIVSHFHERSKHFSEKTKKNISKWHLLKFLPSML